MCRGHSRSPLGRGSCYLNLERTRCVTKHHSTHATYKNNLVSLRFPYITVTHKNFTTITASSTPTTPTTKPLIEHPHQRRSRGPYHECRGRRARAAAFWVRDDIHHRSEVLAGVLTHLVPRVRGRAQKHEENQRIDMAQWRD